MRICGLCGKTGEVMDMFSRELAELNRNTTRLMIEELQDKVDEQKEALQQKDAEIEDLRRHLAARDAEAPM